MVGRSGNGGRPQAATPGADPDGLVSLVYVSHAPADFDEAMLRSIQESSIRRNPSIGVTGMLLHLDGRFLQLLEGPRRAVADLYDWIEQDPRHSDLIILHHAPAPERLFPSWSMGVLDYDQTRPLDTFRGPIRALIGLCLDSPNLEQRCPALARSLRRAVDPPGAEAA